jgi:hypothetical protein
MNYFSKKVGLHTLIGVVSQPDINEITQLIGLHIRYVKKTLRYDRNLRIDNRVY